MSRKDDLGERMKTYYEQVPKTRLMRRVPVCLRLDGKAFHTFTRKFERPFDNVLIKTMQDTMKFLCENIQGCVLGYTQSDEITLIIVDYKKLDSQAWFDYEVQKMCSVAASMATLAFNKAFEIYSLTYRLKDSVEGDDLGKVYKDALYKGAMFDARCFNMPKEEVTNLIYWRQKDASKNSVQMVGRAYFSHKELQNKNGSQIQDMLMTQKGVNWNDYPVVQKRGSCCIKEKYIADGCERSRWIIDNNIPIFTGEDREYIDKLICIGE